MYRIDNSSASPTLPTPAAVGPNPNGYFTNGNPATPTPATVVDQDWLNTVQEELIAIIVAFGLTPSKTTRNQVLTAIQDAAAIKFQAFTTSGTFTVPAGVTSVVVQIWGGGGAGSGCTSSGPAYAGGTGAYAEKLITGLTPGQTIAVTVGTGGAAGASNGGTGGNGTTSSFGSYATATGGIGGSTSTSGAGGTASGGDINLPGGVGAGPLQVGSAYYGAQGVGAPLGGYTTGYSGAIPGSGSLPGGAGAGGGSTTASPQAGGSGGAGLVIVRY